MSLSNTNIDFLKAAAEAHGTRAKVWQIITGCLGFFCAVTLKRCWGPKLHKGRMKRRHFKPKFHKNRIHELIRAKQDYVVGIGWHGEISNHKYETLNKIFGAIADARLFGRYHTMYLLSKIPKSLINAIRRYQETHTAEFQLPDDLWIGVSVNKPEEIWKIGALTELDGFRRFVFFEPLMGNWVNLATEADLVICLTAAKIEQVVIGGWSQRNAYENPETKTDAGSVKRITEIAHSLEIKVYHKKNLVNSVDPRAWVFTYYPNLKEVAV